MHPRLTLAPQGEATLQPTGGKRWRLCPSTAPGPREAAVASFPFRIGRAEDCELVLPDSMALRASTSRWHCNLFDRGGRTFLADGRSEPAAPEERIKPSISGTFLNGRRILAPEPVAPGDVIGVGPWRFLVAGTAPQQSTVLDAGDILRDVVSAQGRNVDVSDPRIKEKFGQLHELVHRLALIQDIDRSLSTLLAEVCDKIAAAQVVAVLLASNDGAFTTRIAWQKGVGRLAELHFSSALLEALPLGQSFFLQANLKGRSVSQSIHDISSGLLLPLWGKGCRLGVLYLDNRRTGESFTEEDLFLASALSSLISLQLAIEKQADLARIEENMARYFAPDVVQRIVESSAGHREVGLGVHESEVSVLFVDIEAFTAWSHTKTARQISEILNPYLETIARAIQEEGGHVNKFIGDAVMGIFGALPGEAPNPRRSAAQAVRAALRIPGDWAQESRRRGCEELRIRIGVNSGHAVVGNIGYSARLEYSVLGDTVNIASRMEKLATPNRAAVTPDTKRLTEDLFEYEDLGEREVKGVGMLRAFSPLKARTARPA